MKDLEQLRFPIGKFEKPAVISRENLAEWVTDIEAFPWRLNAMIEPLDQASLNWQYRKEGWTIQQVVHHCADSHMNALIRFKLALTEDMPTIKPYLQDRWAEMSDVKEGPISPSIKIIEGVHERLGLLLRSLIEEDMPKKFFHPEYDKQYTIAENIGSYAWHSNHHLAHIAQAIESKGKIEGV